MKILDLSMFDNLSSKDLTAEQLKTSLAESGTYLRDLVVSSTNEGNSFDQVERAVYLPRLMKRNCWLQPPMAKEFH